MSFKIILTVLIGTVISNLIIGVVVCLNSSKSLQQMMYEDLLHSVNAVANEMRLNNEREIRMLQTLASDSRMKDPAVSLAEKVAIARAATSLDKDYIDVSVLDMNGQGLDKSSGAVFSASSKEYFTGAKGGKLVITDPSVDEKTKEVTMTYSYPVKDSSGRVINVLYCVVNGFKLSDLCMSHPMSKNRM